MVAVPLELLASPLKNGRPLGGGDRSALVIGGTEKIRTRGEVVFCKVVAVAEAQVKRDGQVRAKGSPVHHATLGPLEKRLESQAGPGVIGRIAGSARLERRFVKGERERLLAAAFMIRVIVLMTLMPEARIEDVIAALAGDLALVPWARPWRPASARAAGDWRNALGPGPLEELRDMVLGSSWREHQGAGCPGAVTIGRKRPLKAGSLDGTLLRVPDTPGNRAFFGSVGTGDDSSPVPAGPGAAADLLRVPVAVRDAARPRRDAEGRRRAVPPGRGHGLFPRPVRAGLDLADGPQLPRGGTDRPDDPVRARADQAQERYPPEADLGDPS